MNEQEEQQFDLALEKWAGGDPEDFNTDLIEHNNFVLHLGQQRLAEQIVRELKDGVSPDYLVFQLIKRFNLPE
jgi:hypothetical protein